MVAENLTLGIAFLAGLLSFFAPCVTVLVPAFLSHLAGVSLTDLSKVKNMDKQRNIFINTIFFIIGFQPFSFFWERQLVFFPPLLGIFKFGFLRLEE